MIDELIEYKKAHYPDDLRRILLCGGTPEGTIHVECEADPVFCTT
jgi:hypothetical protein